MKKSVLITFLLLALVAFYLMDRYVEVLLAMSGFWMDNMEAAVGTTVDSLLANPLHVSFDQWPSLIGLCAAITVLFGWVACFAMPKPERVGEEYGSAKWGTIAEAKKFTKKSRVKVISPRGDTLIQDNNLMLSKNCGVTLGRMRRKYQRNINVLLQGGSGTGKTRFYYKPNIMNLNCDYIITDPKGTLLLEVGQLLVDAGYEVRSFNVFEFLKSLHYNPLRYVRTDADILKFVKFLIKNTKGGDGKGGAADPFWEDSESLFYTALIAYLRDWCEPADYTLDGLLKLLSYAKAKDEDEDWKSPLDYIFEEIKLGRVPNQLDFDDENYKESERDYAAQPERYLNRSVLYNRNTGFVPYEEYCKRKIEQDKETLGEDQFKQQMRECGCQTEDDYLKYLTEQEVAPDDRIEIPVNMDYALRNYEAFKTAAGKTLKSIIISCNVRLAPLATSQLRELLTYDEMHLEDLGNPSKKTALFAIMEDTDDAYAFMIAMLMWQVMNFCCGLALTKYNGRFPRPINLFFDEFANIGYLTGIHKTISVIRSRNILATLGIQSYSQLVKVYDEETARIIQACCDSKIYLGGDDKTTCKEWSESLGKATINTETVSVTDGKVTKNYQKTGRELMLPDEVEKIDNDYCLVKIRGANPWKDKKFVLERHPNYNFIFEPNNKRAKYKQLFDFKAYRRSLEPIEPPEEEKQELFDIAQDEELEGFGFGTDEWNELMAQVETHQYLPPEKRRVIGAMFRSEQDYIDQVKAGTLGAVIRTEAQAVSNDVEGYRK